MHIHVALAYALVIWWPQRQPLSPAWQRIVVDSTALTWAIVVAQLAFIAVAARVASDRALRVLREHSEGPRRAQHIHLRQLLLLRILVLVTLVIDVTITRWPEVVLGAPGLPKVPGLLSLAIIAPFLIGTILLMLATFPIDQAIRPAAVPRAGVGASAWDLRSYLSFNVRHQLLVVVVPMTLIMIVYDLTGRYESQIAKLSPIPWLPDILLGIAAGLVFLIAPWLLKHIWTTHPMPDGALRRDLEDMCGRTGIKCRDILVWRSGGMIVNAAVMGVVAPLRYVMLSDGLIESMDRNQIKAVFGHEAGHVRHRHIQFFLLFALASMLVTSGLMEWLIPRNLSPTAVQAIGLFTVIVIWATGFGFISQRFERQADLFGAQSVAPTDDAECVTPCAVHPGGKDRGDFPTALCATGADIFASALDRVAMLNGIPPKEYSWRHSSIANRIDSLDALSADPARLASFERGIRRIKAVLLTVCVVGLASSVYYVWPFVMSTIRNRMN